MVNSKFHLFRSKTLPTNDFELTVPNLYFDPFYRPSQHDNEAATVPFYVHTHKVAMSGFLIV